MWEVIVTVWVVGLVAFLKVLPRLCDRWDRNYPIRW